LQEDGDELKHIADLISVKVFVMTVTSLVVSTEAQFDVQRHRDHGRRCYFSAVFIFFANPISADFYTSKKG